jgi:diguanylate cyclase (GGDEF)-like protein/PAS domain S-box-containing protein
MTSRKQIDQLSAKKALHIAVTYAVVAIIWILFSDSLIMYVSPEVDSLHWWQTGKGCFFVLVTSVILFFLIRRSFAVIYASQEKIKESENLFAAFMEHLPVFAFIKDRSSRFLFTNKKYEEGFGPPPEEWIGKTFEEMVPGTADNHMRQQDEQVLNENRPLQTREIVPVLGGPRIFLTSKFPIRLGDETVLGGISIDITESEKALQESKSAQAELNISHRAIESSSNGVMICEIAETGELPICYVNPAFEKITGYAKSEIQGLDPRFLEGTDTKQLGLLRVLKALRDRDSTDVEVRLYRKNGEMFWSELKIAPVQSPDEETTHFVAIITDISERKQSERDLEHKATHDSLTGLPNRSLLADRIEQAISFAGRSRRTVAVLLLDLDRFKRINDTLGHSTGDLLLTEIARRLRDAVREGDTVARFGGDEFVIVLTEIAELRDVGIVMGKVLESLCHPVELEGRELEINTSIGVSLYPKDGRDAESLIQKADLAMYQAKRAGGNTFRYFSPEMTVTARELLDLEGDLRDGLKRQEFILLYQPKVGIRASCLRGCEALVRWQHPTKGLMAPDSFIPVAEESGMILALGEWILEEACRQAKTWEGLGPPSFRISVNVSARQFREENFVPKVREIFKKTGADPYRISLELTESMVLEDIPKALTIMGQLKELGISLQLDDFGTGFSNFNSLRQFKVDYLKIDRSFINDALQEPSAAAIVQSIIAIAHNLGIVSVAEGVETQEQLEFLKKNQCDEFQGYLFSEPIPAESFAKLFT